MLDISNNTVINTINVGTEPLRVQITPDGTIGYVSNYGYNNVTVIDVSSDTVDATDVINKLK